MAGDVVEDVRLRQIVELAAVADRNRRGKRPSAQAVKELVRGDITGDGLGAEAAERAEEFVDVIQLRDIVRIERKVMHPFQKPRMGKLLPPGLDARIKATPGFLVLLVVKLIRLLDINMPGGALLLNERGTVGGQADGCGSCGHWRLLVSRPAWWASDWCSCDDRVDRPGIDSTQGGRHCQSRAADATGRCLNHP